MHTFSGGASIQTQTFFVVVKYSSFLRVFNMKGCWILSNAFSALIKMIMWFFPPLLMWCITLVLFCWNTCIPGISFTWSWWIILLICCWVQFTNLLLGIFESIFGIWICDFFFLWCFICLWYQSNVCLIEWVTKYPFLLSSFLKVWERLVLILL